MAGLKPHIPTDDIPARRAADEARLAENRSRFGITPRNLQLEFDDTFALIGERPTAESLAAQRIAEQAMAAAYGMQIERHARMPGTVKADRLAVRH